jgi:hypothetical protein
MTWVSKLEAETSQISDMLLADITSMRRILHRVDAAGTMQV